MKRCIDICLSFTGLFILLPFLVILGVLISLTSRGGPLYTQLRIGRNAKPFTLLKFRTMHPGADRSGSLTIGQDKRVTGMGHFLRAYKLDELPQLWNVVKGDMSLVGPRPEVPEYVARYTPEQLKVLTVRPGLTDFASLEYIHESEHLGRADDPQKTYLEEIMPHKLLLNLQYIEQQGFLTDLKIMGKTFLKIIRRRSQ